MDYIIGSVKVTCFCVYLHITPISEVECDWRALVWIWRPESIRLDFNSQLDGGSVVSTGGVGDNVKVGVTEAVGDGEGE